MAHWPSGARCVLDIAETSVDTLLKTVVAVKGEETAVFPK